MAREKPSVIAGFLVGSPGYEAAIAEIFNILLAHETYKPERVEFGGADLERIVDFEPESTHELAKKWISAIEPTVWHLETNGEANVSVTLIKTSLPFVPLNIRVARDFLNLPGKIAEFVGILKKFYETLYPVYGYAGLREMIRPYRDRHLGMVMPGTNLERGLPDPEWLMLLGPEYVEMFGPSKVKSAPCYGVEFLADGGALLALLPSPFDYFKDTREFERRREVLKNYLGKESFDTGDPSYHGQAPQFRFLAQKTDHASQRAQGKFVKQSSWISPGSKAEWEKWIQDNRSIALDFIRLMGTRGVQLDFSEKSLRTLDDYIVHLRKSDTALPAEFLKKVGAYVAQIIIRATNAKWSFRGSKDIPSLWSGDVQISPLVRAEKVIQEGETFEQWYQLITKTVLPSVGSKREAE